MKTTPREKNVIIEPEERETRQLTQKQIEVLEVWEALDRPDKAVLLYEMYRRTEGGRKGAKDLIMPCPSHQECYGKVIPLFK